ncbi:iron-sulfur cluster biosynthesis chaperone HscA [Gammaproteobacteria bacterium]
MALLQIAEPGQSTAPHQRRWAAGIDLGTTHSLVAVVRSGVAETLPDEQGRHLLPSVVHYRTDGLTVGDEARALAAEDPWNSIASVKRLMGRGIADIQRLAGQLPYRFVRTDDAVPRIATASGEVTPVQVSAEVLKVLARRAEAALGASLTGVVITVPAYFDEAQRQATKDAATLAGLTVLRLLNEPTAAAVAYGLDRGAEGVHAIYDLGGGTFDISILRLHRGVFEVLATAGDSALGGDDFDRAIAEWMLSEAGLRDPARTDDPRLLRRLQRDACRAKEALSDQETVAVALTKPDGGLWQGTLTRVVFQRLVDPLIAKTLAPCRRALRDAGLALDAVDQVVLVGGSTRTPRVRERVAEFFGKPALADIDPDRVVALGAAIQADLLAGNRSGEDLLLLDVIPLSLGLETMGGLVEKIVPRNTAIPVARAQEFTTFKDGQTAIALHVVQGERERVADCRSLAHFTLRGLPPKVAGAARVRVTFAVDADGLLNVTATETTSGVQAAIEVKPSYGLGDDEIAEMLRDSLNHAQEDLTARCLAEQRVEAERTLEALRAALARDGALLDEAERGRIDQALEHLVTACQGTDATVIGKATQALEKTCESFVERRMNQSIRQAMQGHRLTDFQSS